MNDQKGWHLVTATTTKPIVTISELVAVTGLSRRTIRDLLAHYQISPLPRYSTRDTLRYRRHNVMAAIGLMPGSGNRKKIPPNDAE